MRFAGFAGRDGVHLDRDSFRARQILASIRRDDTRKMDLLKELLVRYNGTLPGRLHLRVLRVELEEYLSIFQKVFPEDHELLAADAGARRGGLFADLRNARGLRCETKLNEIETQDVFCYRKNVLSTGLIGKNEMTFAPSEYINTYYTFSFI